LYTELLLRLLAVVPFLFGKVEGFAGGSGVFGVHGKHLGLVLGRCCVGEVVDGEDEDEDEDENMSLYHKYTGGATLIR
jgi:hypothetical protein